MGALAPTKRVLERLEARLSDARNLVGFHAKLTGEGPGRRYEVDALNRGAVILSVAAWEAFVEDLALNNARVFGMGLRRSSRMPEAVREPFLVWLHGTTDFSKPSASTRDAMWGLTGQGWRRSFRQYSKYRVHRLGPPSPKNVRSLFRSLLGIEDITESWGYRRWAPAIYCEKLDATLALRHRIAHGSIGNETVGKTKANDAIGLTSSLAHRCAHAVESHMSGFNLRIRGRRGIDD